MNPRVIESREVAITLLLENEDWEGVRSLVRLQETLWRPTTHGRSKFHLPLHPESWNSKCRRSSFISPVEHRHRAYLELQPEQRCQYCEALYKKEKDQK